MATTKKAVKAKPLSDRAWKKLTPRQKKANDAKRYEKERAAELKAAAAAKEQKKLDDLNKKYVYTSAKTGRKVSVKYALANPDTTIRQPRKKAVVKKVASKTTAKKVAKSPVKKALAKAKKVVDKAIEKAKVSVRPGTAKPKKVKAGGIIESIKMVSGLDGFAKTYAVIAEKPLGSSSTKIAVRFTGNQYRVHAFPDFKTHGIDADLYTSGAIRSPKGDRGQYQTRWVGLTEFKGFLVKLGESEEHAHLAAKLLAEKFGENVLQEATA